MQTKRVKRTASQTPVYRLSENLLEWATTMTARFPKALPYQVTGGRFISNICDILDLIAMAYNADREDIATRHNLYGNLCTRMLSVKTAVRIWTRQRYTTPKGDLVPVVSPKHEAKFLELVVKIEQQLYAWLGNSQKGQQ